MENGMLCNFFPHMKSLGKSLKKIGNGRICTNADDHSYVVSSLQWL